MSADGHSAGMGGPLDDLANMASQVAQVAATAIVLLVEPRQEVTE